MKQLLVGAVCAAATLTAFSSAHAAGGCGVADHRGVYGACRVNPYGRDVYTTPGGRNVVVGHNGWGYGGGYGGWRGGYGGYGGYGGWRGGGWGGGWSVGIGVPGPYYAPAYGGYAYGGCARWVWAPYQGRYVFRRFC